MEIYEIIGHDNLVYLRIALQYLLIICGAFALYRVLAKYLDHQYRSIWFGIFWVLVYLKSMYDIADEYFDSLVVTNLGLVLFSWNWLFSYSTHSLQRVSIEAISEEQNSLWDRLFKKWDLHIKVEDEQFVFRETENPTLQIANIIKRKHKILGRNPYTEENELSDDRQDRFNLLVEALWEVVSEYVERKWS